MPRALLSVSDKTGIVELGRGLAARGFELVSTGGTARALAGGGLRVVNVSEVTGFPEMMDGRVKTLHPALHGGILARRDRPDDLAALTKHGLGLVDLVVVNLYPFAKAAADPATPFDALVEEIDIGGPSLVRAAAKNFRGVLVVVDPADYGSLLKALDEGPTLALRYDLMRKAIAHTAAYDTAIAGNLSTITLNGDRFERPAGSPDSSLAGSLDLRLTKIRDLRYGENPHQRAAWYRPASRFCRARCRDHSSREGALLYESARPRCRCPDCPGVRRAGGRGRQAHQPVRRGDRRFGCRRVRPGAGSRQPRRIWGHRGAESRGGCRDGRGHRVDIHRSRGGAVGGGGGAGHPGAEDKHARRDHGSFGFRRREGRRSRIPIRARGGARAGARPCLGSGSGVEFRVPSRRPSRRHQTPAFRAGMGGARVLPGGCART